MKLGYLSQHFEGVALKRLSAVEVDVLRSNQHEFNGVQGLRDILGEPDGEVKYSAKFLYLNDQDNEPITDDNFLTWYDARRKARLARSVMRREYRLYFPSTLVSERAAEGDLLVIAKRNDNTLLAVVAEKGSTIERQILWLFGFPDLVQPGFAVKSALETDQDKIGFAARVVLEQIGVEPDEEAPNYLEEMLTRFEGKFPRTMEFSRYARSTLDDKTSLGHSDAALIAWMEREEILFRTLERHLLADRLKEGFSDTDDFISLSLSVQNRRKSRAGSALENHLEQIFIDHSIGYTRTAITENALKPDFVFPGINQYRDPTFPEASLTMLAAKSTCKDRWRQIINEAARIPDKHLLTLEPSISENQTKEMQSEKVRLVLPKSLHETYNAKQREWLMGVSDFIELVRGRQIGPA